ncbi:hypothetical protein HYC85_009017 [Camellia sinensis]|uniref:AP2/ERF domain-containing protein n=1 Tax=Camellia sinensis TaxID=4442 RepID=A0A7J7HVA2_CAMSI|nr:hypothetical protein HYC85_009017 [Camellia sinensis]
MVGMGMGMGMAKGDRGGRQGRGDSWLSLSGSSLWIQHRRCGFNVGQDNSEVKTGLEEAHKGRFDSGVNSLATVIVIGQGIDGQEGMKLICGTRIAGMNHKTRKEDKVQYHSLLILWKDGHLVALILFFGVGNSGAYDDEEAAAHAYDLAALKYWGPETILNFPLPTYQKQLIEMEGISREEFIGSLRRKSSGFSRGVSKYRGVARHHHNGRWEARIGRVFGNKYLYLGTYGNSCY